VVEKNDKFDVLSFLKSGIGVGTITILGYLFGFLYEEGYANYFKIPVQLIKLDLITIFTSILVLLGLIWLIFSFLDSIYMILSPRPSIVRRAFIRSAPYILFFLAFFFINIGTKTWHSFKWIVASPFLISLFNEFVLPLIGQRGKGTYYQKLEAYEERRKKNKLSEPSIVDLFVTTNNVLILRRFRDIVLIIFFIFLAVYMIGASRAERQKEFLLLKNPKNIVVLKIYGDKYICAPFDPNTKTVEKSLYIIDSKKQDALWFDWQEVGPLKL
jgi:hypothetical protein